MSSEQRPPKPGPISRALAGLSSGISALQAAVGSLQNLAATVSSAFKSLPAFLKSLQSLLTSGALIALLVAMLVLTYREMTAKTIRVLPFEVSDDLAKRGFTPLLVASLLHEQMREIETRAWTSMERSDLALGEAVNVELPVPGLSGVSYESLVGYLRELTHQKPPRVDGHAWVVGDEVKLHVTITRSPPFYASAASLEPLIAGAAEHIYRHERPVILAFALEAQCRLALNDELLQEADWTMSGEDAARLYNLKGKILLDEQRYEEARESFAAALQRDPDAYYASFNEARSYHQEGKAPEEVIARIDALIGDRGNPFKRAWRWLRRQPDPRRLAREQLYGLKGQLLHQRAKDGDPLADQGSGFTRAWCWLSPPTEREPNDLEVVESSEPPPCAERCDPWARVFEAFEKAGKRQEPLHNWAEALTDKADEEQHSARVEACFAAAAKKYDEAARIGSDEGSVITSLTARARLLSKWSNHRRKHEKDFRSLKADSHAVEGLQYWKQARADRGRGDRFAVDACLREKAHDESGYFDEARKSFERAAARYAKAIEEQCALGRKEAARKARSERAATLSDWAALLRAQGEEAEADVKETDARRVAAARDCAPGAELAAER